MEGKGLLFKIYAGIDVFDIEVDEKDPEKFIAAVKASPLPLEVSIWKTSRRPNVLKSNVA